MNEFAFHLSSHKETNYPEGLYNLPKKIIIRIFCVSFITFYFTFGKRTSVDVSIRTVSPKEVNSFAATFASLRLL